MTTTIPESTTLNIANQSQFGPGDAVVSNNDYFLGAQNFDTGSQTIGGFVHPFGVKTGVQATFDLNGSAGLDLGYSVDSGSFNASYQGNLTQSFNDATAIGPVAINTGSTLSNGTLSTQSPSFGASADAVLNLGGSLNLSAAALGKDYSKNVSFGGGVDQELFSFNRNNDQSINILGQPVTGSQTVSQEVSETPPISVDATFSTQNNPLGANESLDVSLSQDDIGAGASANLGSASQSVPIINLNAGQSDSSGKLSASSTDDSTTQLAGVQLQMGALAAAELGLPPVATQTTYNLGPASVSLTPLSLQLGPNVYANQSVSATPITTITYVFDHAVMVSLGGAQAQLMNQVTFTPGEPLSIAFDGRPITVTPYMNLDLQFHNTINLDVSVQGTLTVGAISATLDVASAIQSALGLPLSAGPFYTKSFDLADLPAITAYDKTFDVHVKSQALTPFTIGGNFQPSLIVTRNDDPVATSGSLRAAVNSANLLAAQNGPNEEPDVIVLGAGTYNLGGLNEAVGDLNITDPNLTIIGAGAGQTIINASALGDRVFNVAVGGGLHLVGATVTGGDSSNDGNGGNSVDADGGGIRNQGTLTLDHVDVTGNKAGGGSGGGVDSSNAVTTITNSTIENNSALNGGGLNGVGGAVLIESSTVNNNKATNGGGMNTAGPTTIVASSFNGNSAVNLGGAIQILGGQLVMTSDLFSRNQSANGGALFYLSNFNDTSANTISGSTFSGNTATLNGGAINDSSVSPLTLTNCTLVQNQASVGGALFEFGTVTINSSTILGNAAGSIGNVSSGGGIRNLLRLTLHNDIIANNTAGTQVGPDLSGGATSQGHNLIGNGSGATGLTNGTNGDLVGSNSTPIDPKLGPLQDNGGLTVTMAPLAGSPAIDAGDDNKAPATDQRGLARPSGSHVDIGAVEHIVSPLTVSNLLDQNITTATAGATTAVSQTATLRDAVTMFNAQGGTNEIDLIAGTYALTRSAGQGTPGGTFGDLVVANEDLTIRGAGVGQTIIDASALGDRVFDVLSSGHLHLVGITITGGDSSHDGNGGNSLDTYGGGIRNQGTLTLDHVDVTGNKAGGGSGGGVASFNAVTTITNSTIENNSALDGGGLSGVGGNIGIEKVAFNNNTASYGGAVQTEGPMKLVASTFSANSAVNQGGAILTLGGQLTLTDDVFSQNQAHDGGALYFITLSGDSTANTVSSSTFSGNIATGNGGAINNASFNAVTLSDSTLVANQANTGGGVYNSGNLTIVSSTFSGNSATAGGNDIGNALTTPLSINSTLVAHTAGATGSDLKGAINASYSLIQSPPSSGLTSDSHTLLKVDPLLAPLANYGGPTQTMALLPGSPAIDAGSPNISLKNDQREMTRRIGGAMDIGAFESGRFEMVTTSGNNQSVPLNVAFAAPLGVTIKAINPQEPVAGGQISWTAPASGASASLSAGTVTIGADGKASVIATADKVAGQYQVTANTTGAFHPASFSLTNQDVPPLVVDLGGPYVVGSEGQLFLSAQAFDPVAGQTLTFTWDVNGDGVPDATAVVTSNGGNVTAQATLTNAQLHSLGVFNLSGPFTVNVKSSDGTLASTAATAPLTAETGPEGGLKNDGPAFAGQPVNAQFFVPDGAPVLGPLHYSTALNPDDLVKKYADAGTIDTQSFSFAAPGTYTVYGRMFQTDGAFSDYTTTIRVYPADQQNALFVDRVYNDLLDRSGSPDGSDSSGPAYWASQLAAGASHENVALAIMSGGEYNANLVNTAFQQYLHRDAEQSAIDYFAPLFNEGATVEQLDTVLASSEEYLYTRGHGTNDGFLDALFQDALHRPVDDNARAAFDALLAGGGTRGQVADIVFGSQEYHNDVVESLFESLLDRPADAAGLAYFASELNAGFTDQQVMAQLIGSDEFVPLA